ncbi:MAG: DUF4062 domain-containing protein, partial [Verrucomicrobiia bacterium]
MQKPGQKSAMISSTAIDLPEHRREVFDACLCEGVFPIGVESLPARDADAIRVSLEMVGRADIYIGIFAWRYGHIPKGHNISITEMEFNDAVKRKIPILVFISHKDHPLTIDMVETKNSARKKLKKLRERACEGRGRREFKSPVELRAEVIHALSDLKQRELDTGSPTDAIRAAKRRLEQLDPRFSVDITATAESMKFQIRPVQPIFEGPKLKFLKEPGADVLKAFLEKGQSFQVKSANVEVPGFPIHNKIFRELRDAKITINNDARFKGCLQLVVRPQTSPPLIQIDGEWLLTPKLVSFTGQLSESPLRVEFTREANEGGKREACALSFKFNWGAWERQPLLSLAYFNAINDFVRCEEFTMSGYIRGNEFWKAEKFSPGCQEKKPLIESMDWFQKCRHLAKQEGANPLFPRADALEEIESNDIRLMVELLERGYHEQKNVGQTFAIAGEVPSDNKPPINMEAKKICLPEPIRLLNFCGMPVPFGPLLHTWTDVRLVAINPLENGLT